ncbi:tetratricopeptide repeat protein [Algicella marina]|uniref:Tetratricopeptide repeat protein n=1 Tax=Algicella marina TaxID=2683284 RepID=A0A6P1SY25_9RHOB|nr:tetratricopeptide repeat protein [Algicella marina]QHQ35584.1 tetratricopeptide repeat protein [Algicella marina]
MKAINEAIRIFAVASLALFSGQSANAQSISEREDRQAEAAELLEELAREDLPTWQSVENKLHRNWSRSGSATADMLLERARELIEQEKYQVALEHLTALTDHAPEFAEGWHLRATVFFNLEEYALAVSDIFTALSLNPHHYEALIGLGIIQEEMGNTDRALLAFEKAQEINPHRDQINQAIERLRLNLGRSTL